MTYIHKTKPFKHQLEALSQSAVKKNFAYFMEMGCFDENVEFLTNRGWISFGEFNLGEWKRPLLVAQAHTPDPSTVPKTWDMHFVEPESFIKKETDDWYEMLILNGGHYSPDKGVKIDVTGDHVFPCYTKSYNRGYSYVGELTVREIEKDMATNKRELYIPREVKLDEKTYKSEYRIEHPDLKALTDDELRFMVAVMADGTFPNKTNNKCDFYFAKQRKADRLKKLARKAGITLVHEVQKRGRMNIQVFHCIAPMRCKVYDSRFYSLPIERLKVIVSEVFHWDGTIDSKLCNFYTVVKDSAYFIEYALDALGWRSRELYNPIKRLYQVTALMSQVSKYDDFIPADLDSSQWNTKDKQKESYVKMKCIGAVKKKEITKTAYCFRVPSGYLYLRYGKEPFIASNSGKTKVMIDNIAMLHEKEAITGAIVLAPKGVYRNWSAKEIPTHLPDRIDHEILVWDAASGESKKRKLAKHITDWDGKKLQFMVFNIESLVSDKGKKMLLEFIKRHDGKVLALVDESTCIKNHKAKRTKAAIEIGQKCVARRIATGSPITNSPLDIFSQCAFLDKSLLGFGSFYSFKNTYANVERIQNRQGQSYEKILSYKNLDNLSEKLKAFSYRITKKECLDLPEKIYTVRDVEITPEQFEIYKSMADSQFALLQQGEDFKEMSVQVVLTKFLRLHQILCGSFTADDGQSYPIKNNRIQALKEVLEETSGKAIIWATYLQDIKMISEMLTETYGADSFVTYYGATSSEDRTEAINKFQDPDSSVRFFLGNVQTAGRGITLTEASTVIYYSNNFSLELRQQSEDRAHRLGQKNNVTYIDLVVRNSLDEKIIKSLISKRNIANEVLKDDLDSWISLSRA